MRVFYLVSWTAMLICGVSLASTKHATPPNCKRHIDQLTQSLEFSREEELRRRISRAEEDLKKLWERRYKLQTNPLSIENNSGGRLQVVSPRESWSIGSMRSRSRAEDLRNQQMRLRNKEEQNLTDAIDKLKSDISKWKKELERL